VTDHSTALDLQRPASSRATARDDGQRGHLTVYSRYELRVQGVWTRTSLTPARHGNAELTSTTTLGTDTTYLYAPTSEPQPRKNFKRSSPGSTTNPENTSAGRHQQKSTSNTHNYTTTVLHFRLEHGVLTPIRGLCERTGTARERLSKGLLMKTDLVCTRQQVGQMGDADNRSSPLVFSLIG